MGPAIAWTGQKVRSSAERDPQPLWQKTSHRKRSACSAGSGRTLVLPSCAPYNPTLRMIQSPPSLSREYVEPVFVCQEPAARRAGREALHQGSWLWVSIVCGRRSSGPLECARIATPSWEAARRWPRVIKRINQAYLNVWIGGALATQSIAHGWNALASRCELALSIQPSSAAVTIVMELLPGSCRCRGG